MNTHPTLSEDIQKLDVATFGYASDRWNFVEGEASTGIISKLNKEQNRYVLSATHSRVVWRTLLFYPGATLVRVTDLSWRPAPRTFYYIGLRGQYRRMNGILSFIEFLNTNIPLKLTEQTAFEYLRFYCFFLRHHGRPFILVEKIEDLGLVAAPLADEHKNKLQSILHPAQVRTVDEPQGGTSFEVSVATRFSDSLFECRYRIDKHGRVSLLDDQELPVGLPPHQTPFTVPAWTE